MKKTILAVSLSLTCSLIAHAQKAESSTSTQASNQTSGAAKQAGKSINLDSGTSLSGQLQDTIDARKARVGDQVILKTTQAIKSEAGTVVNKGSRLVGHITEVVQSTKGKGESRIGILFDRLEQGTLQVPITATITSITNVRASAANDQDLFASDMSSSGSASSSSGARSSSAGSSAGLLGGGVGVVNSTTSTVGSAVGRTTSAVGSTVHSTTGVVGNPAAGVGQRLGGIQISQSSTASVEGSSVLSLQGQNLRLEKGTNFDLVLTQSANAGTSPKQ